MVKMKSIKTKLTLFFGVLIFSLCVGLGTVAYLTASDALSSNIDESLIELSAEASKVVSGRIQNQLDILETYAQMDLIKNPQIPLEEKLEFLKAESERNGHLWMIALDKNGTGLTTAGDAANVQGQESFEKAMSGQSTVSDPMISWITGSMVVIYITPIINDGEIIGALAAVLTEMN